METKKRNSFPSFPAGCARNVDLRGKIFFRFPKMETNWKRTGNVETNWKRTYRA
jgi:hypothetical protein